MEPLHLKLGNGFQVTRYISSQKQVTLLIFLNKKSWRRL
jgi:hypothetical protein